MIQIWRSLNCQTSGFRANAVWGTRALRTLYAVPRMTSNAKVFWTDAGRLRRTVYMFRSTMWPVGGSQKELAQKTTHGQNSHFPGSKSSALIFLN